MAPPDHRTSRFGWRRQRRPRRNLLTAALVLGALVVAAAIVHNGLTAGARGPATFPAAQSSTQASAATAPPPVRVTFPAAGRGTFAYAFGEGGLLGSGGPVHRFKVAVENGMGQDAGHFAATVDQVLGDPRSWIASGQLRLQRVPPQAGAEFTIFLATPATSAQMCATEGLYTGEYSSCRIAGKVIINVARWLLSVPDYGAPLSAYQAYAINHEVGHQLGHGHESCPGRGRPAPVMQQQTFGLAGCIAYAWPYLNGRRYAGPPA